MISDVLLSVIVNIRNQADGVSRFVPAITEFLDRNFKNYEVILVDDASADSTAALVKDFTQNYKNLRYIRLARHYGSGIAITAGLQHAIGDYAAVMQLDDPFAAILELLARCRQGYDVVFAENPSVPRLMQTGISCLARFGRLTLNPNGSNFAVLRRKAMNTLLTLKDRMHNLQVLAAYMGIAVDYLQISAPPATVERPWRNLLHVAESVIAYSRWPLWWLGAAVMSLSALGFTAATINWILSGLLNLQALTVMLISALLLLTNGVLLIVATAIGRILVETKRQPLYHVTEEISSRSVNIGSIVRAA